MLSLVSGLKVTLPSLKIKAHALKACIAQKSGITISPLCVFVPYLGSLFMHLECGYQSSISF